MVKALELMPNLWLQHERKYFARVTSLVPYAKPRLHEPRLHWLINGEEEGAWHGIKLMPELLEGSGGGWIQVKHFEDKRVFRTPNQCHVVFVYKSDGVYEAGTILFCAGEAERPIKFVHELQLQYFAACCKPLIFIL